MPCVFLNLLIEALIPGPWGFPAQILSIIQLCVVLDLFRKCRINGSCSFALM